MRFYLATKLENARLAREVALELGHWGWCHTYDWTTHGSVRGEGQARLEAVARRELHGVLSADIVIVLLPGGRGTHVELGAALAAGKDVVIWSPHDSQLRDDENTCAFYWHSNATRLWGPLDELYGYLRKRFGVPTLELTCAGGRSLDNSPISTAPSWAGR